MFIELNRAPAHDKNEKNIFSHICFNLQSISSVSKDRSDEDVCHIRVDGIWMAVAAKYEDVTKLLGALSLEDALYIKEAADRPSMIEYDEIVAKPTPKKKKVSKK